MTDGSACSRVRQTIPELANGMGSARDQAVALRHVTSCATCRRELDETAAVTDELLSLAPQRGPPAGFDAAVLRRLTPPGRRFGVRRALLVAAAAAALGGLSGGLVWQGTAEDRGIAQHYRRTFASANGQYMAVGQFAAVDGSVAGRVFAYQGDPSWIFITVTTPGPYRVVLRTRDGSLATVGTFSSTSWGTTIAPAVHNLADIRLSRTGSADLVAVLELPPGPT